MKSLALLACLACAAAPRAAAEPSGQEAVLCQDVEKPFFSVACADGACLAAPNRRESQAPIFRMDKPAGVKRVFVLGESAATLLQNGPDNGAAPKGLQIVNCGVGGYESWRIQGVLKEVLAYKPDLIVILSGNNEGGNYRCPGLRFELQRRARRLLERFYSLRLSKEDAAIRATLKIQESRLDAMAAAAQKSKVPLLLCALPANLAGLGPSGAPPSDDPQFLAGLAALGKKDLPRAEAAFGAMLLRDPRGLYAHFFLARALQAAGRTAEARDEYLKVVSLDPRQDRTSRERNSMIRRVAARRGAGVCDLEGLFYSVSPGGIPGLEQFADGVHWRPAYNRLVWKQVAADGRALGLAWLPEITAAVPPAALGDEEVRRTFSYALSYLDNATSALLTREQAEAGFMSERALDMLDFLRRARPGLMERAAASQKEFDALFMGNFWSRGTASRLGQLRPLLAAHLAELALRRGDPAAALALADKAAALDGQKPYFRLVRAGALAALGRLPQARGEIAALYHLPILRGPAAAIAAANGLRLPGGPVSKEDRAAADAASRKGMELFQNGDLAGAEAALQRTVGLNPSDAEAYLTLCSARFKLKKFDKALEACDLADIAAEGYYPGARRRLISEALYAKGLARLALGRPGEAAADFAKALQDPPKDWPGAEAARAELSKLGRR
jgi:tetratricopeptide (TPR) repeat protein